MRSATRRPLPILAVLLSIAACSGSSEPDIAAPDATTATATEPSSTSTPSPSPTPTPQTPLPVDPAIVTGTLANGLTYYIRENDSPGGEAALRLVVNAGSVLEADDRSGVAHFLEHMLFNGTEAYPRNELIEVLEGFGSEFGPEVNAFTSFDETVYELSVRAEPAVVTTALGVLREWASRATISEDDVTDERGVVLDEWRVRAQGAAGRQQRALLSYLLADTAYADREPIGTSDAITAMTSEPLRRFYTDWYRPDLMAVVVVGDIDAETVRNLFDDQFGDLPSAAPTAPERPEPEVPAGTELTVESLFDPELPVASALISFIGPATPETTVETYQQGILTALAFDILNSRFADDVTRAAVPFTSAGMDVGAFVRGSGGPLVAIDTPADAVEASIAAVLTELARVGRDGFTDGEVQRAVTRRRTAVAQTVASVGTIQDGVYADEYVANFLTGSQMLGVDDFAALENEALDAATPDTVAAAFTALMADRSPAIFQSAPEGTDLPTAEDLRALYAEIGAGEFEDRQDDTTVLDTLLEPPTPIEPSEVGEIEAFDATILEYPNGATVVLKETNIAEDSVRLLASSPGGTSVLDRTEVTAALAGTDAANQSGIGGFGRVEVDRFLADRSVGLGFGIDATTEQLGGEARTEDLEVLFQLLHLAMADPQVDPQALTNLQAQFGPILASPDRQPGLASALALFDLRFGEETRLTPIPDAAQLAALDAPTADAVVTDRFANAGDFVFVLVGDFDIATATELANTYVATLDGDPDLNETVPNIDPGPPPGIATETVAVGQDAQGVLTRVYTTPTDVDVDQRRDVDLLGVVVASRLRARIREELAATYSPDVQINLTDVPTALVEAFITITGDPEGLDLIADAIDAELADLVANGPDDAEFNRALEQVKRDYGLVSNSYWTDTLLYFANHPEADPNDEMGRTGTLRALTAADLQATAALVFPGDRYIEVRTVPGEPPG